MSLNPSINSLVSSPAQSRPSTPIDPNGLSWPSKWNRIDHWVWQNDKGLTFFFYLVGKGAKERRDETIEERQVRQDKIAGAVRTILECIGEDPDREGLLKTPDRYAKALLFFTKGYEQNVKGRWGKHMTYCS